MKRLIDRFIPLSFLLGMLFAMICSLETYVVILLVIIVISYIARRGTMGSKTWKIIGNSIFYLIGSVTVVVIEFLINFVS